MKNDEYMSPPPEIYASVFRCAAIFLCAKRKENQQGSDPMLQTHRMSQTGADSLRCESTSEVHVVLTSCTHRSILQVPINYLCALLQCFRLSVLDRMLENNEVITVPLHASLHHQPPSSLISEHHSRYTSTPRTLGLKPSPRFVPVYNSHFLC